MSDDTSPPIIEGRVRTDDLHHLKEGSIFVDDETGKKYRVVKEVLAQHFLDGPTGRGDPEDRTLRRLEADAIIPDIMNREVQRVECRASYLDFVHCLQEKGSFRGTFACKPVLAVFNECKLNKFTDPNFRQRITEEYIKTRSEHRRTGLNDRQMKLAEYRKFKQWEEAKGTGAK